jgi:hypothetical protein
MTGAEDLLKADFDQCFIQMRHYDTIFTTVTNFSFAFFTAVVTATILFLYQSQIPNSAYFGLSILFGLVAIIGILILSFLLRNRCYFTFVARFVNEVRGYYLSQIDSNFKNETGLPASSNYPRMLSPGSTQTIHMYFVALFNTAYISASILVFQYYSSLLKQNCFVLNLKFFSILALIVLLIQIAWIIIYLHKKDNLSANHTWWGK